MKLSTAQIAHLEWLEHGGVVCCANSLHGGYGPPFSEGRDERHLRTEPERRSTATLDSLRTRGLAACRRTLQALTWEITSVGRAWLVAQKGLEARK